MKDTSPEIEARFQEMMMRKSGQERMKMGFSMFEMARRQVIASIKADNPSADENDVKRGLFMRFYGQDFSPEEQEKIIDVICNEKRRLDRT